MAVFYPSLNQIKEMRTPPTNGEWRLLSFLENYLRGKNDYEIFFQPHLEGYRPDIVILRKGSGVLIIEVKDYNMDLYHISNSKNWYVIAHDGEHRAAAPTEQVLKYKKILYTLFVPELSQKLLADKNNYALVSCAVFLSEASSMVINYVNRVCNDFSSKQYNIVFGTEQLCDHFFTQFFDKCWLSRRSKYFSLEMYNEMKDLFYPSDMMLHEKEHYNIKLDTDKKKYIHSQANYKGKLRGGAGSGKTMVLAAKAIEAAKRINADEQVLILTYNITLRNYIRDRIMSLLPSDMQERRRFLKDRFIILHYHEFIMMYYDEYISDSAADEYNSMMEMLENNQHNVPYTLPAEEKCKHKYKAIFVDEVQDYKKEWLDSLWKVLAKDGEIMFFADEKQSIYEDNVNIVNEDKKKRVYTGVSGAWKKLPNKTYRLHDNITELANAFQQYVFKGKYEFEPLHPQQLNLFAENKGVLRYHFLKKFDLYKIMKIYDDFIAEMREKDIHVNVNDICFLGEKIEDLRLIDQALRLPPRQRFTCTVFETEEEFNMVKIRVNMENGLTAEEKKKKINNQLRGYRRVKRFNFNMERGGIKLSTIHSFKGWEIRVVFLLFGNSNPEDINDIIYDEAVEQIDYEGMKTEVLYTGLTRAKEYLILINIGNKKYDKFFQWYMKENN